jgi:hypothetical protein
VLITRKQLNAAIETLKAWVKEEVRMAINADRFVRKLHEHSEQKPVDKPKEEPAKCGCPGCVKWRSKIYNVLRVDTTPDFRGLTMRTTPEAAKYSSPDCWGRRIEALEAKLDVLAPAAGVELRHVPATETPAHWQATKVAKARRKARRSR